MSRTLEDVRRRAADAIAEAEGQEVLRELLPPELADLPEPFVCFTAKPEPWVSYDCATVADVRRVLDAFRPWAECVRGKDRGCTWYGRAADARDTIDGPESYLVHLRLEGGRGFGPHAVWTIHTERPIPAGGARLLRVNAKLGRLASYDDKRPRVYPWRTLGVRSSVRYDGAGGSCTRGVHEGPVGLGDLTRTKWAAGSLDAYAFSYWYSSPEMISTDLDRIAEEG
jgi:hypothetical protein